MKLQVFAAASTAWLALAGNAAVAASMGTVVEVTPVIEAVPVVERVCVDEPVVVGRRSSGGGALFGAIVGGVVGNAIGAGSGRAAATGLGIVAGAALGDHAEANSAPPVTTIGQRCGHATRYEERVVGYDVVYEFDGSHRTARMPRDPGGPGTQIPVEVQVMPAGAVRPSAGRRVPPAYAARDEEGFGPPPWPYVAPHPQYIPMPAPVYAAPYPAPYYYGGYGVPRVWIGVHHRHRRR